MTRYLLLLPAALLVLALVVALGGCAGTPPVRDRIVEVKVPVPVQPITAAQVPALPAPLPKRPDSPSVALDLALAKVCEFVSYALRADPLLRISAGLPPLEVRRFPECERR